MMAVQCSMVSNTEAMEAVLDAHTNLEDIARAFGCEANTDLAALYLDARKNLEELKDQIRQNNEADTEDKGV